MQHSRPPPEPQPAGHIETEDFRSLYLKLRPGLEAQARHSLSRPPEIEDVVQETLLRVYVALPALESEIQALAFARRVLTNLCIDRYRAEGRRPAVISLDTLQAYETVQAYELRSEVGATDVLVRAEDASIVREAFAQLIPEHRAALVKRELEEKSLPVIADELGVPIESVKHLLFRARRSLRRLLAGTSVVSG